MRTHRLLLAASTVAMSSFILAGCATPRIPRAPTTQASANSWRPYADGTFRGFDSFESGPKRALNTIGAPATSPAAPVLPTDMHAERRVSTRERVFQGDQFSVNYLVVLFSPSLGRVEMLEANAQNVLAQIKRIAERDNGVDEARIEFGDEGGGGWSVVTITRDPTGNGDGEVRVTNGRYDSDRTLRTVRFRAKEFRAALIAGLQDVERLKRQAIVAP